MASLSECLSLLSIDTDDAAEIRALARENGGNVRAALQSMLADLNADRQAVLDRITETLGPAPAVPTRDSGTTLEQAAQQVQRTPEFQQWFEGSQVVDENGQPLVVYHGTGADIEAFDPAMTGRNADSGFLGTGVYFSDRGDIASYYTQMAGNAFGSPNVMPVYLSMRNPFMWGEKGQGVRGLVMRGEPLPPEIHDEVIRRTGFEFDPNAEPDFAMERILSDVVREVLMEMGYDGVIATFDGRPGEFVAFRPEQIKSIFNERPTNDPRIMYQPARSNDTSVAGGLTEKSYITTRDLQGATIFPMFADLTDAGSVYDQMDGMPLAPTPYLGGPNFPWLQAYRDAGVVWAFNKPGVITRVRNKARALRDQAIAEGRDGRVVITMLAMKDDAHTSNEMTINALLRTLDAVVEAGRFPADQLQAAQDMITSKAGKAEEGYAALSTFPGFDNAQALHDWIRSASFTTRKALAKEMQSAAFQQLPGMFPVARVVREAIDPDYRATQQGDALLAFEIDPDADDLIIDFDDPAQAGDVPRHPAYRYGMRGTLVGSFSTHIPMEVLYADLLPQVVGRAKPGSNPKFLMERLKTEDGQVVTEDIVREAEVIEGLHDYRIAQAYAAGVAGRWRSSDNAANKGGVNPVEFERALIESDAAATLTKYTRDDVKRGKKDGSLRVFQLGDTRAQDGGLNVWMAVKRGLDYRQEYPGEVTNTLVEQGVLSDSEVALVGVASNELGVSGMATFQVLKGIEEGVTVLDAFKVKSPSKPDGLLPAIYATMGFEEVGEIPFDPQYFDDQQLADLRAIWTRQGWNEADGYPAVAIMKWRGDDAARSGATRRFVLESQDGLGVRGVDDLGEHQAAIGRIRDGDVEGDQGDGVAGGGDGRADPRRYADRARGVSSRTRGFVQNLLSADQRAIDALKLPRELIDSIRSEYGLEIDARPQDRTLNQDQTGEDAPRGNIEIPGAGVESGTTVINLFDGADTSTVIHESGHYFYEVFSTLASDPNAPQQMKDDLAALQAWMGVEPGKAPSVAAQERMARGMERYVLEGKAPSIELARVFASFKQWMLNVYANVKSLIGNPEARQRYAERQLKINLTDDVREVFDRLLATDDMIAEAQDALNMRPMFSGEAMGDMDARTQETYQRLARNRTEQSNQKLIDRAMAAVRRRKEAWWKAERKTRLAAEMDRLNGEQRYRALDALATGQMAAEDSEADPIAVPRIDRDALIEMFGKGIIDELGPRNFGTTRAIYTTAKNADGMSPQEAAELFEYRDAQEMIDDIRQAGRREQIAEANVDQAMTEEYGDPFTDGSIEAEALEAVHSDNQADMVALELRHIARKRGQDTRRMQTRFFKARAAAIIGQLEVRQVLNPNRFLTAERRAAKAAERALAGVVRGDAAALAEAQQAKEQQLLNHYLYLEARDLERVISRKREEMRGYDNADRRKRIGSPHIEQIDAILENYEFRQRSQAAVQRNLNLAAYLQRMEQEGRERELSAVDPRIVEQAQRVHYTRLSVDELRGVFDTVDNIAHVGRRTRELVTARRKRMLAESAARVADQVLANQKLKDDSRTGIAGRIWNSLSRVDTIAVRMDGGEEFGTFHNEIKREIDEAQAEEQRLGTEVMEKIGGLFETHYTREELRDMAKERSISNAGLWTREQAIMIALNTGTESNMDRVMDQRVPEKLRMTQQRLDAILSTLDERDWRFVQDTWNLIDGYWPQSSEVEQRRTGVKPKKIDARPMWQGAPSFVTGGYFRLYYDGDLSARAKADQDRGSMFEGMSQTRRGGAQVADKMMTGRQQTAGGMPVLYSFSSITRQLRQATRFIALTEAVDGTARILNHPLVQDALRATGNLDVASTLDLWLKDIASGPIYDAHWVSSSARLVKNNFTISRLGFNLKTVLLQLTGLTQASVAIGHGNMARGLAAYGRNLTTIHNDIIAKSPFMQERMSTFQKDIYDFRNEIAMSSPVTTGYNKFMDTLARYSFEPMIRMQFHGVDVPTWLGAYEAALADGQSEQDAVYRADRMVARSQDSALMADRAALERGTVSDTIRQADLIRLFTTLGGYMMTKMNRANVEFLRRRMQIRQADSPAVRLGIAMKLAGDLMILYAAESAIMGLMYAMLSDEDEPEDLIRFIVSETASTAVGGIPFLRDSVGAFRGFEGGVYGSVTSAPARAWTQISQGEIDDSFWRSVLEVAGTATGMPSTQTYRIIEQFTGDDEGSWSEALIGSNPLTR